jgi:hypothetical protein
MIKNELDDDQKMPDISPPVPNAKVGVYKVGQELVIPGLGDEPFEVVDTAVQFNHAGVFVIATLKRGRYGLTIAMPHALARQFGEVSVESDR